MKNVTLRRCEIVSNLQDQDGNYLFDLEHMAEVLDERACIKDWSYIIHDKCTYSKEEEKQNPDHKAGTLKAAHVHLIMRFNQPQHLENIAKWFGVAENFVSKIHGKWESAVKYQIHKNAPDKYQYPIEEVTANFDVRSIIEKENEKQMLDSVIGKILNGDIREYNKTIEIDQKFLVRYSRSINEAFKVRSEHLQATVKERNMECIFITGGSSMGKTTLAKQIAHEKNLACFVSSGSNDIMDGYKQEPCFIADDIRPSSLGLSDLLKMLEPHTASSVKSRYYNKYLNCELIILTTVLDIDTFYKNVFSENDEPIIQLKRRCRTYIQMSRDSILVSLWDDKALKYTAPVAYKNTVLAKYIPEKNKTKEDVKKHVHDLMPFLQLDTEKNDIKKEDAESISIEDGMFHLTRIPDEKVSDMLPDREYLIASISDTSYEALLRQYDAEQGRGHIRQKICRSD